MYDKFFNNFIEMVVYADLVILSAATSTGVSTAMLTYSLVGVVFSFMVCIILYQFYGLYIAERAIMQQLKLKLRGW
jgi:phosphoglycerol transferase MdoB-like AlkP superfamily enzyme